MTDFPKELDSIDMKLVQEMQRDASQTSHELAQQLGMSASGVRRRTRKLKGSGLIRIIAVPHIKALGNNAWVLIGINVTPGKAHSVASGLTKFPSIYTVALSLGRYDIVALGNFTSTKEAADFVSQDMPKIQGIYRSETLTLSEPIKYHGLVWEGTCDQD
ncbi:Lrp/AsnC family transcriptional regulator [Chloroflexota bacterium]